MTQTTVEAMAVQAGAEVAIDPPDADEDADGRQTTVVDGTEVTVTVISPDGSRRKVYLVRIGDAVEEEQSVVPCLGGAVTVGFSLLVHGGGSVEDLAAWAQTRSVTALYVPHEGEYAPYTLGAPDFVNGLSVFDVSVSGNAVERTLASAVAVAQEVTPKAPTVTAASATSLTVIWTEPPNAKPPITDYDVQYRVGSSGNFTDWPHAGIALTSTIIRLTEGTTYQVQVLARSPEGASGWSTSGSGTPAPPAQHRTDGVGDRHHTYHRERGRRGDAARDGERPRHHHADLRLDQLGRWDLR